MVELLLQKGVSLQTPPPAVQPNQMDPDFADNYRKTPFIIQAACKGNLDTLQLLIQQGADIKDAGVICLSRRRRNVVSSNVLGAAAYHGHARLLKWALTRLDIGLFGGLQAAEHSGKGAGPLTHELGGYTPLMLACCTDKGSLDVVKALLSAGAGFNSRDKDGSNLLHITARSGPVPVLEYLVKNLPQEYLFERNQKGETPLTICEAAKNTRGVQMLESLQAQYDRSHNKADDLLAQLEAEEEREAREKAKRKEKKYRSKVAKIAAKEGISVDQVEEKKAEERMRKDREEEEKEKARLDKERREEAARLAEIEARRKEQERLDREYDEMVREQQR